MPRVVSLLFFSLLGLPAPSEAQDRFGITANKTIVYVESRKIKDDDANNVEVRTGTGFVFDAQGYVLTAAHVLFEKEPGHIYKIHGALGSRSNAQYPLELVYTEPSLDLALLAFPENMDVQVEPLKIGKSNEAKVGDHLYAYGFPSGLNLSLAEGSLSAKAATKGQWRTTLGINRGQSGGPVFNDKGEWLAVAVAGDESKQQVSYAVPETRSTNLRQLVSSDAESRISRGPGKLPFYTDQFKLYAVKSTNTDTPQRLCVPTGYTISAAVSDATDTAQNDRPDVQLVKVAGAPNCIDAFLPKLPTGKIPLNDISIEVIGAKPGFWDAVMNVNNELKQQRDIR